METKAKKIQEYIQLNSASIAERIVELQYAANPAYWDKFGAKGKQISIRDAGYHLPFLTEAMVTEDKGIFTDYVAWVKVLFQGLNFPDTVMINTLLYTREVLFAEFKQEYHYLISEYIDAGLQKMSEPAQKLNSYIDESTDMGKLARRFINYLLDGDRGNASKIILDAVETGVPVKEIYLEVFQKSQYEVGRLWLSNQISVAKEHFCSAATQLIMSQLYPYIFETERIGKTIVTASIGGELHEIGIRIVADFFEMKGWDTYYMGANTPTSSLIQAIEENQANLLGLSIAMPYHRSKLEEVIMDVRKSTAGKDVKIMIGGNALNSRNGTWKTFNADGYAPDAQKATEIAEQLVE